MPTLTYHSRRGQLESYFDRTAHEAWAKLTSDVKVSRIRETVRAGREQMRDLLLSYLPGDLHGLRLLDAGCGPGMLAIEAARRGADVTAIDISPKLIALGRERTISQPGSGKIDWRVGDMNDPALGRFDVVVAMDSLIHYRAADAVRVISALAERTGDRIVFTFAPRTPALALMHAVGTLFPRSDRAPAIEPVAPARLQTMLRAAEALERWQVGRSERVQRGFYTSQTQELGRT